MESKRKNHIIAVIGIFTILYGCYFNAVKTISISFIATLILGLGLLGIDYIINKENKLNLNISLLVFVIFSVISLAYTKTFEQSIHMLITYLLFLLISVFLKYREAVWKKVKLIILSFSLITLFVTIAAFISKDFYINTILPTIYQGAQTAMYNLVVYANSFPGIFASTGLNAFFLSVGYFIVLIDIVIDKKKSKWKYLLLILFVLGIFLTLKRIALCLDIIITIVLFMITSQKKKHFTIQAKNIKYIILIIIIFIIFFISFQDIIYNLVTRFFESDDLLNGRIDLYEFAIEKIYDNPLIGNGLNSYYTLYGSLSGTTLSTHNEFLQLSYELGVIQAIIMFTMITINIVYTLKICYILKKDMHSKVKYKFAILSLLIQIYFILYCFTGNPFHDMNVYCIYMLFVTMTINIRKEIKNNETSKSNYTI